ncbi:hypothetical protein [Solibacillus sp.]|uniref:hypothetical protein n=1 Tax=Solibacillus sp. TaxID=1909654 RepID=UPI0033160F8A
MDLSKKYWISSHEGISRETLSILNEYLLSLKLENKAEATIKKYSFILERFLGECSKPIKTITSKDTYKWFQ